MFFHLLNGTQQVYLNILFLKSIRVRRMLATSHLFFYIYASETELSSRCLSKPSLTMTLMRIKQFHVRKLGFLSKREIFFRLWARMMQHGGRRSTKEMPIPEQAWFPQSISRKGEFLAQNHGLSSADLLFSAKYHSSILVIEEALKPCLRIPYPSGLGFCFV